MTVTGDEMKPPLKDALAVERGLVAMLVIHVVAMLAMPLVLARFLPGGGIADDAERVRLIVQSPWLFRLGWSFWQLTALIDFLFAVVLVRAPWLPRAFTVPALVLTLAAIVPDQYAQGMWVTHGIALAQTAPLSDYLVWEARTFVLTAGWGATGYTAGTLVMLVAFAKSGTWSKTLSRCTAVFCLTMIPAAVSPLLPMRAPQIVVVLNAVGFVVLLFLYAAMLEAVLARRILDTPVGRWAPWRHPSGPGLIDALANSRFFYALLEPVPVVAMISDITDVIYVNYLVDAALLERLVPEGLELQRIGPSHDKAIFTFLTYRHGHFGFRMLGPLRKWSPSAVQTNWRIHVRDPKTKLEGIFFVTNAIDSLAQALGARLFSEGMPMHVLASTTLRRDGEQLDLNLEPGLGTAPDARLKLQRSTERVLPPEWAEIFGSWDGMLGYVVPQNRALSSQPYRSRITHQEIQLPIALADCAMLTGTVTSNAAQTYIGDAQPVCFHVPRVAFLFESEVHTERRCQATG